MEGLSATTPTAAAHLRRKRMGCRRRPSIYKYLMTSPWTVAVPEIRCCRSGRPRRGLASILRRLQRSTAFHQRHSRRRCRERAARYIRCARYAARFTLAIFGDTIRKLLVLRRLPNGPAGKEPSANRLPSLTCIAPPLRTAVASHHWPLRLVRSRLHPRWLTWRAWRTRRRGASARLLPTPASVPAAPPGPRCSSHG